MKVKVHNVKPTTAPYLGGGRIPGWLDDVSECGAPQGALVVPYTPPPIRRPIQGVGDGRVNPFTGLSGQWLADRPWGVGSARLKGGRETVYGCDCPLCQVVRGSMTYEDGRTLANAPTALWAIDSLAWHEQQGLPMYLRIKLAKHLTRPWSPEERERRMLLLRERWASVIASHAATQAQAHIQWR